MDAAHRLTTQAATAARPARLGRHLRQLALGVSLALATSAAWSGYQAVRLDSLGGSYAQGLGINNAGQVVGGSTTAGNAAARATLWSGGVLTDLGALVAGGNSIAYGINNAGQVVGASNTVGGDTSYHASLWNSGLMTDLGTVGGKVYSEALAINDLGQAVGMSHSNGTGDARAVLWSGGQLTDLGTLGGTHAIAWSINNAGQVAGRSDTVGDAAVHATLWSGGVVTDLGTLGGANSWAYAINNAGQVVGASHTADGALRAALWSGGLVTDLGTLGGTYSVASDINDLGQVVGWSDTTGDQAWHLTLWADGTVVDLNDAMPAADVLAGWVFESEVGLGGSVWLNDNGWILVNAGNIHTSAHAAYLLRPDHVLSVPEPSSALLMLMALGTLATRLRGRRNA